MKLQEKVTLDFNTKMVRTFAQNIYISLDAYKRFINSNKDYFNTENKRNVLGHLRTFAVERQFFLGSFEPNSQYTARFININNFGCKTLQLETDHFILNIGRTIKRGKLPTAAKYKKELAKLNKQDEQQLQLNILDCKQTRSETEKNYAILAYGYNDVVGITYFDFIIPDSNFTSITMPIKNLLLPKFEIVPDFDQKNEPVIASLRSELLKEFNVGKG